MHIELDQARGDEGEGERRCERRKQQREEHEASVYLDGSGGGIKAQILQEVQKRLGRSLATLVSAKSLVNLVLYREDPLHIRI